MLSIMRTSLNKIKLAEQYLHNELNTEDSLMFEAHMLTDPELKVKVSLQQKVYALVKLFHRNRLKQDTEAIHQRLFNDPLKLEFQQSIYQLFNN